MATLAFPPPDEPESWDSDPDLDLPSGPLHLGRSPSPSPSFSPSAPHSPHEHDRESGFFEALDARLDHPDARQRMRTREEENESSRDSSRSSTTTGTLTGLIEGLSLDNDGDGDGDATLLFDDVPASPPPTMNLEAPTPRSAGGKTTTLRASSSLSALLSAARPSGRGRVHHLGSTPHGQAQPVDDGDWDHDLELGDVGALGLPVPGTGKELRRVAKKGSFASHLSLGSDLDDFDDDDEAASPSMGKAAAAPRKKISIASFSDADSDALDDLASSFDLPASTSHLTLSLASRGSVASLRSTSTLASSASAPVSPVPAAATLPVPAQAASPAPSSPGALTERETSDDDDELDEDDDDATFFDDLVLPSYFGAPATPSKAAAHDPAGAGELTPPTSEAESEPFFPPTPSSSAPQEKVDLQRLVRLKLEQRGGRGLLFHAHATSSPPSFPSGTAQVPDDPRLAKHREPEEEPSGADLARELRHTAPASSSSAGAATGEEQKDDEEEERKWSAREMRERMRTISGARAREAQREREARRAAVAGGGKGPRGHLRRTASDGKAPPVPSMGRRPAFPPSRSSTGGATTSNAGPSRLSMMVTQRPASAQSDRPARPPSAASNASSTTTAAAPPAPPRRGPPPPAPSAASRDRVRMRTTSLRTVGSVGDMRGVSGGTRSRPPRLDAPGQTAGEGRGALSPVPSTPSTPSSASTSSFPSGVARPTLRTKRSQQHLSTRPLSSATAKSLERKRSLQNLAPAASTSSVPVPSTPSSARPPSRQTLSRRSPSPSSARLPSFAAPTASSASRTRERVHSNPPALLAAPSTPTPASSGGSGSAFSATGASFGLLRPSRASAAGKGRPTSPLKPSASPSPAPSAARLLARPLTARVSLAGAGAASKKPLSSARKDYGDGTELDAFDDLPVSKERERERVVSPRNRGGASRQSSGASTATVTATAAARRTSSGSGGGSWGRKNALAQAQAGGRGSRIPAPAAGVRRTGSGEVRGRKEGAAAAAKEKEKEKGKAKEGAKEKEGKKEDAKKGKKPRREPHLIRHLGGAGGIKVQGDMTYNPVLQRWEGNESILREFDKALATSTRPALISPFSSTLGSPARTSFPSPVLSTVDSDPPSSSNSSIAGASTKPTVVLPPGAAPTNSRAGIKVVGDMVFDPATCSWHALGGVDAEDELELDWGGGGTSASEADDEPPRDGWEEGERERMLKNRASFVLEEGSSEGSDEDGAAARQSEAEGEDGDGRKKKSTKRRMWRESKAAEERCRVEMEPWAVRADEREVGEEGRRWLWELRALIMDTK
ncbi:hypothetical protein JCM10207_005244 [Rhodosporidiobolus poonsookiae]